MARNRHCDAGQLIRDTSSSLYLMKSQSPKKRVNDESLISSLILFFQRLLFGLLESWCLFGSCDNTCHMTFDKSVQNWFNSFGHGSFSALFFLLGITTPWKLKLGSKRGCVRLILTWYEQTFWKYSVLFKLLKKIATGANCNYFVLEGQFTYQTRGSSSDHTANVYKMCKTENLK